MPPPTEYCNLREGLGAELPLPVGAALALCMGSMAS
jgi:hypothetical protein